ncbi:MAG: hypothetical protein R3297_02075, partial [Desulfobulbales bacterium]|nr:hypothetical protein [Desulfobulbales bacterium]
MISKADRTGAVSTIAAYQTISSFERLLVQLIAIIYEPVNRITICNCLRRARITGPRGEWLTPATIGPFIRRLQEIEVLDNKCRCADELVELASRDAVAAGTFANMAAAVQAEIPFSQYQSKWPQRCLRTMRQYRIGLYAGDMAQLENMQLLLEKQCEDEVVRFFPAVRFCNNPFDPEWLRRLAPSLQFYILSQLKNFSLHYLALLEMPFSYLKSEEALQSVPEEERLPFHRLLAGFLLWRGKTAEVEELIGVNPQSFVASGMAGCLDFMRGNNEQALVNFEKDLHQLKKIGSRRRVFF